MIAAEICGGETYTWEIKDSWGDGICCVEGPGAYVLKLDGVEIHSGGDYGSGAGITFPAPRPSASHARWAARARRSSGP